MNLPSTLRHSKSHRAIDLANTILVVGIAAGWFLMGGLLAISGDFPAAVVWCIGMAAISWMAMSGARKFGWRFLIERI